MEDKTLKSLVEALNEAGIIKTKNLAYGRETINRWVRSGKLKLRINPVNKWKIVNDLEIAKIVTQFSFGGTGRWSYDQSSA